MKDFKLVVTLEKCQHEDFLNHMGKTYILGGDFNAKHQYWGSRLTNGKGIDLLRGINKVDATCLSEGSPTYWPSDPEKYPDCIDFFVVKAI